ncbi:ubiquitin fusion degradation protein UFD1-domain-containing protein [Mycena sp. CBHHK59/15]|nr:ubiquitin fusion degradation protein UFD1-domain-containing protein [Mycena sp. CBHHK59/15]
MAFFGGNPNGPSAFFSNLAAGGYGPQMGHAPPRAYDEYFKAYSVAMLPGKERLNLSYGGKIIMPPSALANLTALDLPSPWMFQLRNPSNSAASTYGGVLEFIAEEGVVHLPYWMMKTLRLNEGDPIRITGAELPKGKLVKLQAQSVHFLEISDHKAVLEQALRNFSALTQGDIIEINYNSITFGILVMETSPGGQGISVLDTDLEVDFAAPVGYVEPEKPKAAPPATMASKLKIDLNSSSPGSSRPGSSLSGGFAGTSGGTTVSKGGDQWESFKGKGETLAGRRTKAKVSWLAKLKNQPRIVSNETLEADIKVPAALNLPFGQLFFGFNVAPYVPPSTALPGSPSTPREPTVFNGSGNTLHGRQPASAKGKEKAPTDNPSSSTAWAGTGQTLGQSIPHELGPVGAGGARIPRVPQRTNRKQKEKEQEKARSPTPDWGVDDDDVIMIDSD